MDTQQLKNNVEVARANLMDALDALDGTKDGHFNTDGLRSRISAEIGRGAKRTQENPYMAWAVCWILGVVMSGMFFLTAGKRLFC